ncbi:energy-coupling factor ABC transporter permease [Burkholderia singularis]|uniref:INTEGRAL MEMBRANE PROTEIN (Rhomboid family) n=1 Tax=Burkholderia singularis TaxID=1503053 RepID=A0A238H5X1_9BURK|nr:energy-coupling factor ABC transporter permease [Burkholderia singularis]SMG00487.1 INTEGRAL MEMBRANE PROTEIN (Rhomboid family) [Burkholderia singularis]
MGFLYTPLPFWVAVGGWIAAVGLLVLASWRRPFGRLQDPTLQHVWLALITSITVLWASNAWLDDGLVMHLLGATLLVTLFDWALSLIAMAVVIGIAAFAFDATWQGVGLTYLIYGALPVAASALLQRAALARLPHNLTALIAGQGIVSPAVASGAVSIAAAGMQIALANGAFVVIPSGYVLSALLLALGEAWFTGVATALIAVYRPAWVTTSDVRRYRLGGPRL